MFTNKIKIFKSLYIPWANFRNVLTKCRNPRISQRGRKPSVSNLLLGTLFLFTWPKAKAFADFPLSLSFKISKVSTTCETF